MERTHILNDLQEIFRDVFDDETLVISDETNAQDIEDWDSLEHINILVMIEKKYTIKFTMDEVASLHNVGKIGDLIERKLNL